MIYAIQFGDGGPIKFGRAKNPRSRMDELQVGSPERLRLLASCNWHDQNETIIHWFLRDSYLRGEWFEPTEKVLAIAKMMADDDFYGAMGMIGRLYEMPRFNKKAYQREYMRKVRAERRANGSGN